MSQASASPSIPYVRFERADWTPIPMHLHAPLERWVTEGHLPRREFLRSILTNDLAGAVRHGSPSERAAMLGIVSFLITECPHTAFGSAEKCAEWQRLGGWRGMHDAIEGKEAQIYDP